MQQWAKGLLASRSSVRIMGVLLIALIWFMDRTTPAQVSFVLFYMIVIVLGTWYGGRKFGFFLAVLSAALWFEADYFHIHDRPYPLAYLLWNTVTRVIQFSVMVWLVSAVRKSHNESLQRVVDKYTRLVESAIEGMIVLGDEGTIHYVNSGASTLLQYAQQELQGKNIRALLEASSHEVIDTVLRTRGVDEKTFELYFVASHGEGVWALVNAKASGVTPEGHWETVLLLMDITERKKNEEELRRRYEAISATQKVSRDLQRSLAVRDRVENAIATVLEVTGYACGTLHLIDGTGTKLELRAHKGLSDLFVSQITEQPLSWGGTVQSGAATFVEKVNGSTYFDPRLIEAENIQAFACIPLTSKQEVIGVLNLLLKQPHLFSDAEQLMLQTFGRQIGVAVDNAQMYEDARRREEKVRQLSVDLVRVQEEERSHFARELHDGLSQLLTTLKISAEMAFKTFRRDPDNAERSLRDVLTASDEAQGEAKRVADDLRPSVLDDFGLRAAIEWQATNFARRTNTQLDLHLLIEEARFDSIIETTIYRIIQELLSNVAKHAEAGRVMVQLLQREGVVALTVADDGKGFDRNGGPRSPRGRIHHGLRNLKERTESLGGSFRIESVSPHGTEVTVELPFVETRRAALKQEAS